MFMVSLPVEQSSNPSPAGDLEHGKCSVSPCSHMLWHTSHACLLASPRVWGRGRGGYHLLTDEEMGSEKQK